MSTPKWGSLVRASTLVSLLASSACAAAGIQSPAWEGTPSPDDAQITVEVENLVWNDVTIYAATYRHRVRLGTVTTGQTARFRIPRHQRYAAELELIADPIGSRFPIRSGPVVAAPGQRVRWVVHTNAGIRALTVW